MAFTSPPSIFNGKRRLAARRRSLHMQAAPNAARYLLADMVEDVIERLAFLRFEPRRALVVGDWTGELARALADRNIDVTTSGPEALDEEKPYPIGSFDFIASLGTLDTVNDLPGALIHLRNALASGGLMIASFPGAGSLPVLRSAMLAADGDRPAPRIHPQIDVRAGGQLLQRAGFADPVIDSRHLSVRFRALPALVADLRAQGLSNVLARSGPPLSRAAFQRASTAFSAAGENGRTTESFEILTLSGWRR
ncbi:MAG: methyltransferase domain-containing protein [Novosphingobium sp.]